MEDDDMSGVDPLRYVEMRKRVAIIREFIATERPSKDARAAFAARLDVGEKQFMRLVSAWRAMGNLARAKDLDGATSGKGGRRERRGGLGIKTRAVMADVITKLGPGASLAVTLAEVNALAAERAVTPPSRSSVWNSLMEARSRGTPSHQQSGIVTGIVFAKLPVAANSSIRYPAIAVAARSPDGAVLAYEVVNGTEAAPSVKRVLDRAQRGGFHGDVVDNDGHQLSTLIGRRIGDMQVIYHPSLAAPAARLIRSKRDAPISLADARHLIATAVEKHNFVRSFQRPSDAINEELGE